MPTKTAKRQVKFDPNNTSFSVDHAHGLALCSKLAYEPDHGVIQTALGNHGFKVKFIERRETQCFVAYSSKAIVISFRGTTNIRDWMTNSDVVLVSPRPGFPKVHAGFLRALCVVWDDILETLEKVQKSAQTLWITGHSLGGGTRDGRGGAVRPGDR